MRAKRDYKKSPRRSGTDRRHFECAIIKTDERIRARRLVPDRRNLVKQTRQML